MIAYLSAVNENRKVIEYDGSEGSLFKQVGEYLLNCVCPNTITVEDEYGDTCSFKVMQRGSWIDDKGVEHPSIHINDCRNGLTHLTPTSYKRVVLTCVHPLSNNYKAYELEQDSNGDIIARYESIDKFFAGLARTVKTPYESWQYWLLYYEKLSKGYTDQSSLVVDKKIAGEIKTTGKRDETANGELYRMLMNYANKVVDETYANRKLITENMVKKSKAIYKELAKRKTVRGFNSQLQKLIAVCPRKRDWSRGDKVTDFMAKDESDFESILDREENLIMAMDAVSANVSCDTESFKQFNIDVFKATDEQTKEVLSYLSASLRSKVKAVYRVKPSEQEKKFADYCKKHNIKTIKKLWHGSRNENWASIIRTSLNLGHGCANGRMFGDGEYFASSAEKSYNYTSCRGTTWARGNSPVGFMGLFATAYGNPYMIRTWGNKSLTQASINQMGYDCVHASSANTGLRADEIIFYDEDAMCLNYIVQFEV